VGTNGIMQAQPHVLAALAAGMQAAGFYRAIVHKGINCNGVLQAAGDWKDSNDTEVENALLAGLLPAQKSDDGGFIWVSTRPRTRRTTTSSTTRSRPSTPPTSSPSPAPSAWRRRSSARAWRTSRRPSRSRPWRASWRTSSASSSSPSVDDAPKGFKNASIRINGTTMIVNVEIKLAGAIYFIPINFLVSQVTQAAA
jgi:hypothetical protein